MQWPTRLTLRIPSTPPAVADDAALVVLDEKATTLQGMPQDLAATIVSMSARIDAQDGIIAAEGFSTPA